MLSCIGSGRGLIGPVECELLHRRSLGCCKWLFGVDSNPTTFQFPASLTVIVSLSQPELTHISRHGSPTLHSLSYAGRASLTICTDVCGDETFDIHAT